MGSLSHLNKYFFKYRWRLLLGTVFIIIQNYLQVQLPTVAKQAADYLQSAIESIGNPGLYQELAAETPASIKDIISLFSNPIDALSLLTREDMVAYITSVGIALCLLYIGLSLAKGLFLFFTRQTIIIMSRLIEYDLKNEVYDQYQRLSTAFYKRNNTGDLMNRISEDVTQVRMYLGPAIMYTINLAMLATLCVMKMVEIDLWLTIYVLSPLPVMSVLIYYVSRLMNQRASEVKQQQSALSSFVQENFAGVRVMKAYGLERDRTARFTKESEHYRDLVLRQVKVDALFMPTIILLIGLSTILSVFLGGRMMIDGSSDFTIGDLVAFVIFVNMLTWPFASVGWVTSLVQRAAASQTRINEFLEERPEVVDGTKNLETVRGSIAFENVSFTFPESGIKALDDVSFNIEPGETLGVFGRTGSGKSTLTALLTRQFDPDSGRITLDGIDIRELNLESLRKEMGLVPQEVFLFSDSIANNIAFGLQGEINQDQIEEAGRDAELEGEIKDLSKGYDTLLGEWGVTLSGGQKQRVSLARAIIRRPKILIFDDSLSAVDTETEESILQTLDRIIAQRSTMLISHRISTIRRANQIIVLDAGKLIARGTHDELLAAEGFYADMDHIQSMEPPE